MVQLQKVDFVDSCQTMICALGVCLNSHENFPFQYVDFGGSVFLGDEMSDLWKSCTIMMFQMVLKSLERSNCSKPQFPFRFVVISSTWWPISDLARTATSERNFLCQNLISTILYLIKFEVVKISLKRVNLVVYKLNPKPISAANRLSPTKYVVPKSLNML